MGILKSNKALVILGLIGIISSQLAAKEVLLGKETAYYKRVAASEMSQSESMLEAYLAENRQLQAELERIEAGLEATYEEQLEAAVQTIDATSEMLLMQVYNELEMAGDTRSLKEEADRIIARVKREMEDFLTNYKQTLDAQVTEEKYADNEQILEENVTDITIEAAGEDNEILEEKIEPTGNNEILEEKIEPTGNNEILEEKIEPTGNNEILEEKIEPTGNNEILEEKIEPTGNNEILEEKTESTGGNEILENELESTGDNEIILEEALEAEEQEIL